MDKAQMAQLLTYVHSTQGGELTQLEVEAWHDAIGDLDYQDAMGAVRRLIRGSDARVKPAHVAAAVRSARNDAVARQVESYNGRSVPRPKNFEAMVAAAQHATAAAAAAGYGRGSEYTKRAAFDAAERAQ